MQCKCGFQFVKREEPRLAECRRFAVIADENYQKFLASEVTVCNAENENAFLEAVSTSCQYVGSMMICPSCKRLVLIMPDKFHAQFYTFEETRE